MPEKDDILRRLGELPLNNALAEMRGATDEEMWEGDENGAHFMVTKDPSMHPILPPLYSLSVSGTPRAVEKVLADFTGALGIPLWGEIDRGVVYISWNATRVDKKGN